MKIIKFIRKKTLWFFIAILIGLVAYKLYAQSPENLFGINEYCNIVISDPIPDTLSNEEMLDYTYSIIRCYPQHHKAMFLIVNPFFRNNDLIYQLKEIDGKKFWVLLVIPIKGMYEIDRFDFSPNILANKEEEREKEIGTIVCIINKNDTTENRVFNLIIGNDKYQELVEVTGKKAE